MNGSKAAAQKTPHLVVSFVETVKEAPEGRRAREGRHHALPRAPRDEEGAKKRAPKTMDAAAEE